MAVETVAAEPPERDIMWAIDDERRPALRSEARLFRKAGLLTTTGEEVDNSGLGHGWGQDFKGGAAYLSARTGAPIVPVHIDGTGEIFGKGATRLSPGRTTVLFGRPMSAADRENTRRFNERIEAAVTRLGDETLTDWWTASRNAASGLNPRLSGPEHNGWRRQWQLGERRRLSTAGIRRRRARRWPDLG